jgi:drug/metabolite transporter (DMT)-like permease
MQHDRPLLGLGLTLAFCVLAPLADATAKILGPQVDLLTLVFMRFVLQGILLIPLVLSQGRPWPLSRRILRRVFFRTCLHIMGIAMMVSALTVLPLAETTAIAFVMPFIVLALGHIFLGEEVGLRRIFASAVGFLGTLLVVQPAFDMAGWAALLPIGVALNFAVFMLVTRTIAKEIDPLVLQVLSAAMACVMLLPVMILAPSPLDARFDLSPDLWGLIIVMGALGTTGHLMMSWALRFAPSATLAPMQYLEIPFAALIGWVIFKDFPNGMALTGIAITIAAGLYVMHREQATSRRAKAQTAPRPMPPETK